ncbi:MAG: RDD family protein [Chloroflexi bacterium]|nr:RDD family protein [Chloroflexota bacterium]
MPTDLFFSYSRKDQDFAIKLKYSLEEYGITAWIDQSAMIAGDAWRRQIVEAIKSCRAFLLILSPHSIASENVTRELSIADSENKKIVPIIFAEVKIPDAMAYYLTGRQYQAFDVGEYDVNLRRLLRAFAQVGIQVHEKIVKPIALPPELQTLLDHPVPSVRETAARELERLLNGSNPGLSNAAYTALVNLKEDDSSRVKATVAQILSDYDQKNRPAPPVNAAKLAAEQRAREKLDAERNARAKAEADRAVREKSDAEQRARSIAEQERVARAIAAEKPKEILVPAEKFIYAGWARRATALLIDLGLLWLLKFFIEEIVVYIVTFISFVIFGTGNTGYNLANLERLCLSVISYAFLGLYFIVFHKLSGQTIGKAILKIRVLTLAGGQISFGKSLLRSVGYVISTALLMIGWLLPLWDAKHQALHDNIAGTIVVYEGKKL